jgi:hypothetical protein
MPPFEEPIHDVKITVDRDLACVWASFEIWRGGGINTATGTSVITCLSEGVWRVSAVGNRDYGGWEVSRRKDGQLDLWLWQVKRVFRYLMLC